MKKIGIIHLSDIHFCSENQNIVCHQLNKLISDINKISSEENICISAICFTGDLINAGSNNETDFDLFFENFVFPLLENTGLSLKDIFFVPGNHEIDTTKIDEYVEAGIHSKLTDGESIEAFFNNPSPAALDRINYFQEIYDRFCEAPLIYKDEFCRCYKVNISNVVFGFACLNSAWRSSGKGSIERGQMIIGATQVKNALNAISDVNVKVCLVHHPLDWLVEADQFDVEKLIFNFDLIFNGHIHTLDSKQIIAYQGQSVVSTCGKFFPTKDFYNGYSIVSIDPETLEGKIFLRQYYSGTRECFDKNLQLYDDGCFEFALGNRDPLLIKVLEILHDIQPGFLEYATSFFVSNIAGHKPVKSFEDAFVVPVLGRFSEYEKESNHDLGDIKKYNPSSSFISIEDIMSHQDKNLIILGRKEYGKTTLLHYLINKFFKHYADFGKIPVLIDCSKDFSGKSPIEKKIQRFFTDFGSEDLSISIKEIEDIAQKGKFVFFFDNFETVSTKSLEKIKKFTENFPQNRYIYSAIETVDPEDINCTIDFLEQKITKVYIHSMGKQQVRALAHSIFPSDLSMNENIIDKALLCFKNTNLPKTPFVISLVLSLCSDDKDFIPLNESTVMQNFLEALLDKSSSESAKTSTYDYIIREDFLCYLVGEMYRTDTYAVTQQKFEEILSQYHQEKGWTIKETKFDNLFFEKGILYQHSGIIAFRYSCMAHYYLAKLALKSSEVFNQIFTGNNYLNYYFEINYLTGLDRNRLDIYKKLSNDFEIALKQCTPFLSILDSYGIKTNFSLPPQELKKSLGERMSSNQSELLYPDLQVVDSSHIKKGTQSTEEIDPKKKLITILLIYATVLKNSELYSLEIKEKMMCSIIDGFCTALAVLAKILNDNWPDIIQNIQRNLNDKDTDTEQPQTEQDAERLLKDTIKISLPLAIENIAFENVGSAKLKNILLNMISDNKYTNTFQCCILVFLYCDLRISGCLSEFSKFVNQTSSKDLLSIALFKAVYYYRTRYFPKSEDNILVNIIADINLKLNNTRKLLNKSLLIKQIQEKRPSTNDVSPI